MPAFVIVLHKTVEEALVLDAKKGNSLLTDAISKEMELVRVAFEVLLDRKSVFTCHPFVQCNLVFNIKMEDFRQRARLVAEDHMTKAPDTIMYASIMS